MRLAIAWLAIAVLPSTALACSPVAASPQDLLAKASVGFAKGHLRWVVDGDATFHATFVVDAVLRGDATRREYQLASLSPDESCAYGEQPWRRGADVSGTTADGQDTVYMPFVRVHDETMVSPFGWGYGFQVEGADVVSRAYSVRMPIDRFERKARSGRTALFKRSGWRRIDH